MEDLIKDISFTIGKASLFYFGHVIRIGGMEYEVMVGRMGVIEAEEDHGKDGLIA